MSPPRCGTLIGTKRGRIEEKMRYSAERKEAVLKKMLPPHNRSIREIAEEEVK